MRCQSSQVMSHLLNAEEDKQINKEVAVDESRLGAAADMSCLCEVA